MESFHRLFEGRVEVIAVRVVDVYPVCLQPVQAFLAFPLDFFGREPPLTSRIVETEFRRNHDVVAVAARLHPLADRGLALTPFASLVPARIEVGRVEKRAASFVKLVEEARAIPNYSYQIKRFTGRGFMCIGDAHRFVDPIFSFGLFTTMKEAQLGSAAIVDYFNGVNRDADNPFAEHQRLVDSGADIFEDTIDLFWEQPLLFARYVHQRYREDMVDILAGRVFEQQPNEAVLGARKILQRSRSDDAKATPEGSRFQGIDVDPVRNRRILDELSSYAVDNTKLE